MYRVAKTLHFSYGHRLINHPGKCAHYHGHNARVEVVCESRELNANAMVVDFDQITRALAGWINETLDHRMILNKKDPLLAHLEKQKEPVYKTDADPTAEVLARIIYQKARENSLPVTKVVFWETPTSWASYEGAS